jgi:hypothetical protein
MCFKPLAGTVPANVVKMHQKLPIRIQLTYWPESLHHIIGHDRVYQHALEATVRNLSIVDKLADECNCAYLTKKR